MTIETTRQGERLGEEAQREYNRAAAEDLELIEGAVRKEAEEYVEAVDGDGDERAAAEAAATAFDFDAAEAETKKIAGQSAADSDDPEFAPHGW